MSGIVPFYTGIFPAANTAATNPVFRVWKTGGDSQHTSGYFYLGKITSGVSRKPLNAKENYEENVRSYSQWAQYEIQ